MPRKPTDKTANEAYIHGYDPKEQKRLVDQAKFLEPWIYEGIDFKKSKRILEVGCGVGAQTKILLKRFPKLKIDGIDLSLDQLEQASVYLNRERHQGRVRLMQADASNLSDLEERAYDGVFVCWFLEHVKDPVQVLKETRKRMKPGSKIFISEVFNQSLFVEPYSATFLKYWFEFNDLQWALGGHPFIGASLGNILKNAGFKKITTTVESTHFDSRQAKTRTEFLEYFGKILMSAAPALKREGRVTSGEIAALKRELARVKKTKDSVFFYSWIRAIAVA
jgi:ubiquinone/menaquinone biosynthesis C-methylase UbiE